MTKLTLKRLKHLLHYERKTGVFTWLHHRGPVTNGTVAGTITTAGYVHINIDGKKYLASRLAWFYETGSWPKVHVDHEDLNPRNNTWENLREATRSQNMANRTKQKNNASGYKGVCWHSIGKKWMASIRKDRKSHYLGLFDNPQDAHAAYCRKAVEFYGEFART